MTDAPPAHQSGWVRFAAALAVAFGATNMAVGAAIMIGAVGGQAARALGVVLAIGGLWVAGLAVGMHLVSAVTNAALAPPEAKWWELRVWGTAFLAAMVAALLSIGVAVAAYSFVAQQTGTPGVQLTLPIIAAIASNGSIFWAGWLTLALWVTTRPATPHGGEGLSIWLALGAGGFGIAAGAGNFMSRTVPMVPTTGVAVALMAAGGALLLGGGAMWWFGRLLLWHPRRASRRALLWAGLAGLGAGVVAVAGEAFFLVAVATPWAQYDLGGWAPEPMEVGEAMEMVITTAPLVLVAGAVIAILGLRTILTANPPTTFGE